jgi:hypothetical protein
VCGQVVRNLIVFFFAGAIEAFLIQPFRYSSAALGHGYQICAVKAAGTWICIWDRWGMRGAKYSIRHKDNFVWVYTSLVIHMASVHSIQGYHYLDFSFLCGNHVVAVHRARMTHTSVTSPLLCKWSFFVALVAWSLPALEVRYNPTR